MHRSNRPGLGAFIHQVIETVHEPLHALEPSRSLERGISLTIVNVGMHIEEYVPSMQTFQGRDFQTTGVGSAVVIIEVDPENL